jgi:hypothetical protein
MPPIQSKTARPSPISKAWYDQPKDRVASAIYNYAISLEAQQAARRVKYAAMYRLVTGEEPPVQMGLWMSRKSATTNSLGVGLGYSKPYSNIMRNCLGVLENRIGTVEPFVQISPGGVSFKVREACKHVTEFIDGIFDSNRYNGLSRLCFRDMFLYGQTYVKTSSIVEDKQAKVIIERIDPTLILVDEVAFKSAFPTDAVELHPYRRSEAMALFGRDDPEMERAIRMAPAAFWSGTGHLADEWIFITEATKLPNAAGDPGRHVICLQNKVITDDEYTRPRYRWSVGRWEPPSQNFYVNGGAYIACPYQMDVNGYDQRIRAGIDANAFTGFIIPDGAGLSAQTMGSRPGFLWKYQGGKPEQVVPVPFPPVLLELRKQKELDCYTALGLTQQNVQGTKPQGVTSGKALRLAVDYSDARNKSLIMSLEELAADVAERVLDEAEEVEPVVQTTAVGSHLLKWADIRDAIKRDQYKIKPFPINRYVGTPGEDAQDAADDYANGLIDKRAYMRLQSLPDLTSYRALATASDDLLEDTLDEIVRTGKFVAPAQTYDDPAAAFKQAQARYNLETRYKSDRKVLRSLFQFMSVLADRIAHPDGQTLQPALPAVASAPGLGPADIMPQSKAAGLPAPPSLQVASANMPIAPLGAGAPVAAAA